jgi:hypothetical protein
MLEEIPREDQNPPREPRPIANKRFVVLAADVPEAPQIRGRTDANGVLRLPVFDEEVAMTLKLEVGDVLGQPGSDSNKEVADKPGNDTEDEKNFMTFKLDAGALEVKTEELVLEDGEVLSEEKKTGIKQRLFNLGYGRDKIESWDEKTLTEAVRAFRRHHKLGKANGDDAAIDKPMVAKLRQVHDSLPPKPAANASSTPEAASSTTT